MLAKLMQLQLARNTKPLRHFACAKFFSMIDEKSINDLRDNHNFVLSDQRQLPPNELVELMKYSDCHDIKPLRHFVCAKYLTMITENSTDELRNIYNFSASKGDNAMTIGKSLKKFYAGE